MGIPIDSYIAIGDSMSIDKYPIRDLESRQIDSSNDAVGAAALFNQNDNLLYPEFEGRDLQSLSTGIKFHNLTEDGFTTEDILSSDMSKLSNYTESKVLITLTAGGNDLLGLHLRGTVEANRKAFYEREMKELQVRFDQVLSKCLEYFPKANIILTTVYDPTDGTGKFPGNVLTGDVPVEYISAFNEFIETMAKHTSQFFLADVYNHFMGHGLKSTSLEDFWYWMPNPIEPGARGASEIRRLWLKSFEEAEINP